MTAFTRTPKHNAMTFDQASRDEWKQGWPVVLGAMFCSGLGIPLFYYVFSIFTIPLTEEFGISRGQMSSAQSLLVIGALVAPLIGRAFDRHGFRPVFALCTLAVILTHIAMASIVSTSLAFAVAALVYGAAGVGAGPLAFTRPINAWFWHQRGLALGLAATGLAITTVFASPFLAGIVEDYGWRTGFWVLAGVSGLVGLPLTLYLMKDAPPTGPAGPAEALAGIPHDRSFFRERDFVFLILAMLCIALPGAGLVSQLSPIVQEEGFDPKIAAFGVSTYAIGQLTGRIFAGWFLDRANPRVVGFLFTFIPAFGFILLSALMPPLWVVVLAVGLIGIQQGAEIDLFAYFTSRRFGINRYGTIYGWIIASSWIGNALGIVTFGWLHDAKGSYALAEAISAMLLLLGAIFIAAVRIDPIASVAVGAEPQVEQAEPPIAPAAN